MPHLRNVYLVLCVAAAPLVPSGFAQTGAIEGIVTDATEAVVPQASVTVSTVDTGLVRKLSTNSQGRFASLALPPGDYVVQVDHPGFRSFERRGILLSTGRTLRLDLQMELGERSEWVVVDGQAPLVSASVADWGERVTQDELGSLPLNGRDYFELGALEAGVLHTGSSRHECQSDGRIEARVGSETHAHLAAEGFGGRELEHGPGARLPFVDNYQSALAELLIDPIVRAGLARPQQGNWNA